MDPSPINQQINLSPINSGSRHPIGNNETLDVSNTLYGNYDAPSDYESFANLSEYGINLDLILKSIFFGAIFYLLSLPEVYKLTSQFIGKKVDNVLVHSLVYAILYYILVHFI